MSGGVPAIVGLLPEPTGEGAETFKSVSALICMLLSLFITLYVLVGMLGITLDLIYMVMPAIEMEIIVCIQYMQSQQLRNIITN